MEIKNMKKYIFNLKSLVLVGIACLGLSSCGDFLNIEPKTFVSDENFWNEKTDVDQMVAGIYVKMQNSSFISRCIVWGELRSDNIAEGLNATNRTSLYRALKENLLSTNEYAGWRDVYAIINACNIIIARSPEVHQKDPVYTESDVLATQAEVAAIRDLCYFYLVRAFKDVPYYTYAVQSEEDVVQIGATDGDRVIRNCIEDLEARVGYALKAYPKDNDKKFNSNCNRITQSAIYSLLADLCLWDGQYEKTVQYAQKVIDAKYNEFQEDYSKNTSSTNGAVMLFKHTQDTYSKGYPMYPCFSGSQYGNDFTNIFGGNQNSFESIFELAFTNDGSSTNYVSSDALASLYGRHSAAGGADEGKGFLAVNENIVSDIANSANGSVFNNRYDCRYYTNIYNPSFKTNEFTKGYVAKYVNTGADVTLASSATLPFAPTLRTDVVANRNFIFYRLTDVMLMQAEALAQLGEVEHEYDEDGNAISNALDERLQRAFYLTWAVNRRSIMTNSTTATSAYELVMKDYVTKDQILELVLKERRRELMFEGKRWFDMLRQCHKAGNTQYIKSRVSAKGTTGSASSLFTNYESLFWPYSKQELKNNPNLEQKAFYKGSGDDEEGNFSSTK